LSNSRFGTKKRNIGGPIVIGVILVLITGAVFMGRLFKSEEKIKLAFKNGQTVSFLIATYNEDKKVNGASVLYLNTKTNRISLVSMLPKTYISFGKKGFLTLEETLNKNISHEEIRTAVARLLDTEINYYLFLKKANFIRLVDLLGGIEIFTDEIKLPDLNVSIPEGTILLDGDKAVEYLTFVPNEDLSGQYDKLKRIQNFITGFLNLPDNFASIITEEAVSRYLYKVIDHTNLTITDVMIIYEQILLNIETGVDDYSPGIEKIIVYSDKKTVSGYDYIYLPKKSGDWIRLELNESLENINKEYVTDVTGTITLAILNGTDVRGLAARAKRHLRGFGFDVLEIGNADTTDYNSTIIISKGNDKKARKLAELIQCDTIVEEKAQIVNEGDIIMIIGRDFDGKKVIR
jgi:anionic cell wall polymer biosynthesis LytR-Cps2A-Psr (LCP) family protein